ncbi:hypothetical protein [Actinotalea sp. Marseille-Q4924]|uniref:hypothetical protein n=1 Tax=Actinotalea sp. Marseille-Q4924 TaxID=2866571 RepID=UPI001CE4860D|nr:hypothetical protein [Actinotalea sp. Marseille-Q4924]
MARRLVALSALAALGYVVVGRPWQLTWGATPTEVARAMPGDDLVPRPTFDATRAITIAAPPAAVFPWLVQVGVNRGGWYSYDLLDNLGRPSARTIVPELQAIAPGDLLPMSPDGRHGITVHSLDAPRWMVWGTPGDTSWSWQLDDADDGATRLVTRVRERQPRGDGVPRRRRDAAGHATRPRPADAGRGLGRLVGYLVTWKSAVMREPSASVTPTV